MKQKSAPHELTREEVDQLDRYEPGKRRN